MSPNVTPLQGRRERRKAEMHDRLMTAAMECFRLRGFSETSVQQITELADVGYGTFFNYFSSKDAILAEMGAAHFASVKEVLIESRGEPIDLRLRRLFLAGAGRFSNEPELGRSIAPEIIRRWVDPSHAECGVRSMAKEIYLTLVAEGQASGEIRKDIDADALASSVIGAFLIHTFMHLGDTSGLSLEERADSVVALLTRGLLA